MPPVTQTQPSFFDDDNMLPPWLGDVANDDGSVNVVLAAEAALPKRDPATGAMEIALPDGSVVIDLNPRSAQYDDDGDGESDFDKNLADQIDPMALQVLCNELLLGYEEDEQSRAQWLNDRAKGIELLGLKVDTGRSGDAGGSQAPLEGMSNVRHPLLKEAVLRAQANSYAELCPAVGPVKVQNYGDETIQEDGLAEALEKDINYYLTTTAEEYYPSMQKMLFDVMFGGISFRKVYFCPIKRRPVSDMVDAADLIVNNSATSLASATRVTHKVKMKRSVMKRMQLLGVYRDVNLGQPTDDPNVFERKIANQQGIDINTARPEDQDYTILEIYCELDIPGFEHQDAGEPTGLPLPYVVTIEKTSRQVLAVRRNWDEEQEDEDYIVKMPFVEYVYVREYGFYGVGLLHILANETNALTASWRLMLDNGMFANFPGFLYLQSMGKQMSNEFRIAPGSGMPIKSDVKNIAHAVMPLPYNTAQMGPLMQLTENIASAGQRVGGTADTPVGEGKQEAPVGTTLALIEQGTKIESTVHKGLHASQDREFRLLKELFRQDPASLWKNNKRCALGRNKQKTLMALEDCDLVPRADPNVPSRMHRLAKIAAVKQLQAQNPMLYDAKAVDTWALPQLGIDDPESLFAPPMPAQQPDPLKVQELMIKAKQANTAEYKAVTETQLKAQKQKQDVYLKTLDIAERIASNPGSLPEVSTFLTAG
jgi:hypothetical protein